MPVNLFLQASYDKKIIALPATCLTMLYKMQLATARVNFNHTTV